MADEIRSIDCREALRQLWDYLDEELDDVRMREVRRHLEVCGHCFPHAEFGHRFLHAVHRARERTRMPSAVRSHVMTALAEAGFTTGSPD